MAARMTVGLVLTAKAFAIAGGWLDRVAMSGQPVPERVAYARHLGTEGRTQLAEVIGQRKLLKWSVPGAAHTATFWGFIVLLLTIIEAYGALFVRTFAIPGIGHWAVITKRVSGAQRRSIHMTCYQIITALADVLHVHGIS